jgi:hypothetical protein
VGLDLLAADSAGEDLPGDFGGDGDCGGWGGAGLPSFLRAGKPAAYVCGWVGLAGLKPGAYIELPGGWGALQDPVAAGFAGDRELNRGACGGTHFAEGAG